MVKLSLFATATASRVDAENGIIRGVRVITKGEARGHSFLGEPMIVDDQTIFEVVEAAASFKDGVPVKLAHGTDIEELVGSIRDIVAAGDCARGDLYLLKSHESYATIIEMAETMPSNFGISISFMNAPEPVKGSDMEPDGDEDDADESLRNLVGDDIVAYAARVCELYSADLVANPATGEGNGLFSQPMTTTPEAPAEEIPVETAPEVVVEPVAEVIPEVAPEVAEASENAPDAIDEAAPEEVKAELEVKGPEGTQNDPDGGKEVKGPEGTQNAHEEAKPVASVKKEKVPAPAELSRSWNAVSTDLAATRTDLAATRTELSQVQTDLAAARGEIATKDAQLVELNMLHRSVLSVMGLSASIEIPEIVEEAAAMTIIEKYESMPAGAERLSFFQANRREIERSIAAKLK
jgi:hypothetical protein